MRNESMSTRLPKSATPPLSPSLSWTLTGSLGNGDAVQNIPIISVPFRVGRRKDLHLPLNSAAVSKIHAEIVAAGDVVVVRDLNSTNGTFVNGDRVDDARSLNDGDVVQFADFLFRIACKPKSDNSTMVMNAVEWAAAITRFNRLVDDREIVPHYQPIVSLVDGSITGYEVLARSNLEGLKNPDDMFRIATQLDLQVKLSEVCRWVGTTRWSETAGEKTLFLNTHPDEDLATDTLQSLRELREAFPRQPIVLEIHESAVSNHTVVADLRDALDGMGVGLAYDDFGAGQSRLKELISVPPDFLKFDISLIQNIHEAPPRQRQLVKTLVDMTHDFDVATLAEGIECSEDAEACRQLGFDYAQGFHFGHPVAAELVHDNVTTADKARLN